MDQNTIQEHISESPWICGQQNVRANAMHNKGQNTDEGHTAHPRIEIKIHDPAGNRTRLTGLEGCDFTYHATAKDRYHSSKKLDK